MTPSTEEFDPQRKALSALHQLLNSGWLPDDLPEEIRQDAGFQELAAQLEALHHFTLALANGDLTAELKMKGQAAGALKTLQANLRHLTYQTQRVAEGDLSQQVHFMGDFALAFNCMVDNLRDTRQALDEQVRELAEGRRAALNLMLDAQAARGETEKAYRILQDQMKEIQTLQLLLQEQVIHDPLTNLYNRRYLDESIEREFARALREGYTVCLALADLDQFKSINDRFGHSAGDDVLKAVSNLFKRLTRAGDMLIRYGGDEFLIVLPNLDAENARSRAEEWRLELNHLQMFIGDIPVIVTASIGISVFPLHGQQKDQVIDRADQAAYRAKNNGRNRVEVYWES